MISPEKALQCQDKEEWRAWLQRNNANEKEVWLEIRKSGVSIPSVSFEEAVEEALCFGWIDGRVKGGDDKIYFLRFSPRKKGSAWSISNRKLVEKLIEQGRMTNAGMDKVREARENGEWVLS